MKKYNAKKFKGRFESSRSDRHIKCRVGGER